MLLYLIALGDIELLTKQAWLPSFRDVVEQDIRDRSDGDPYLFTREGGVRLYCAPVSAPQRKNGTEIGHCGVVLWGTIDLPAFYVNAPDQRDDLARAIRQWINDHPNLLSQYGPVRLGDVLIASPLSPMDGSDLDADDFDAEQA